MAFASFKSTHTTTTGLIGKDWIVLKLVEAAQDFMHMTTGGRDEVFRFILTKQNPDLHYRIGDFIQYESSLGKNVIVAVNPEDLKVAKAVYAGHSHRDAFLRPYEPKIMVHTTTKENYTHILADGFFKSWNRIKSERADWEDKPIGAVIGDPDSYSDYIMFGTGGAHMEIIPSSKQKGRIEMDLDSTYTAGARLYFNGERVASQGIVTRDGVHFFKVRDSLSLKPHLIWAATPTVLGLPEQTTPRIFAAEADAAFARLFGIKPVDTCY